LCGDRVGSLHFTEVWPLPEFEFRRNVRYWTIEGNASGRLARLLAAEYGLKVAGRIGRYDGLPIDATTILEKLS
jgi:2-oxoglutarate ferredoxin oxidoreductase subunit alpha